MSSSLNYMPKNVFSVTNKSEFIPTIDVSDININNLSSNSFTTNSSINVPEFHCTTATIDNVATTTTGTGTLNTGSITVLGVATSTFTNENVTGTLKIKGQGIGVKSNVKTSMLLAAASPITLVKNTSYFINPPLLPTTPTICRLPAIAASTVGDYIEITFIRALGNARQIHINVLDNSTFRKESTLLRPATATYDSLMICVNPATAADLNRTTLQFIGLTNGGCGSTSTVKCTLMVDENGANPKWDVQAVSVRQDSGVAADLSTFT